MFKKNYFNSKKNIQKYKIAIFSLFIYSCKHSSESVSAY